MSLWRKKTIRLPPPPKERPPSGPIQAPRPGVPGTWGGMAPVVGTPAPVVPPPPKWRKFVWLLVIVPYLAQVSPSLVHAQCAVPYGVNVYDEGGFLSCPKGINFTGAGVSCVVVPPNLYADCTIPGGGGGGLLTTKGDLLTHNGAAELRFGVGANGLCLQADSGTATGLIWGACGSGAGDITDVGDCTGPACFTGVSGNALQFEGATANGFETTLTAADPGADFTLTLPAITGNLCTDAALCSGYQGTLTTGLLSATLPVSVSGARTVIGGAATISIADAAADGATKGAASFAAADFTATAGNIVIDYTNGQAASGSNKGFLTSADWTTFNNKTGTITAGDGLDTTGTSTPTLSVDLAANQGLAIIATELGFQDCAANEILKRNAGDTQWTCQADGGGGGTPATPAEAVQYNSNPAGSFDAEAAFTYNETTDILAVPNVVASTTVTSPLVYGGTTEDVSLVLAPNPTPDLGNDLWDGVGVQIGPTNVPTVLYNTAGDLTLQGTFIPQMMNKHDSDNWTISDATCVADNSECTGAGVAGGSAPQACCTGVGTGTCGFCNGASLPIPCASASDCRPSISYASHFYHTITYASDSQPTEAFFVHAYAPILTASGAGTRLLAGVNGTAFGPELRLPAATTNLNIPHIRGDWFIPVFARPTGAQTGTAGTVVGEVMGGTVSAGWTIDDWVLGLVQNPSGAGTITDLGGLDVEALTAGAVGGKTFAVRSAVGAASHRYTLLATGDAQSVHLGKMAIGTTTNPTKQLEVIATNTTGQAILGDISGTLTAGGQIVQLASKGITLGAGSSVSGLKAFGTAVVAGAPDAFGTANVMSDEMTYQTDGSARATTGIVSFAATPSFDANGFALTMNDAGIFNQGAAGGYWAAPLFKRTSGASTQTAANYRGYSVGSFAQIGGGWTITDYVGFRYAQPGTVTGTITNQIGLDIGALSAGGEDYPIAVTEHTVDADTVPAGRAIMGVDAQGGSTNTWYFANEAETIFRLPIDTPSNGEQLTWNTGGTTTWESAGGSGGGPVVNTAVTNPACSYSAGSPGDDWAIRGMAASTTGSKTAVINVSIAESDGNTGTDEVIMFMYDNAGSACPSDCTNNTPSGTLLSPTPGFRHDYDNGGTTAQQTLNAMWIDTSTTATTTNYCLAMLTTGTEHVVDSLNMTVIEYQ